METIMNDTSRIRSDGRDFKNAAVEGARKLRSAGGQEVQDLMADVHDLLGRVAHVADPEIARLRTKVEAGLATAKTAIGEGADQIRKTASDAMASGDDYVRDRPWQAVGVAAAAGLLVGFLVGRR
jgi:ElaB/YqjD/DUF883 family membrane-anchored ribosome-binding protein